MLMIDKSGISHTSQLFIPYLAVSQTKLCHVIKLHVSYICQVTCKTNAEN